MVCIECLPEIFRETGFNRVFKMIMSDTPCCYNDTFRAVTSEPDEIVEHNDRVYKLLKSLMHQSFYKRLSEGAPLPATAEEEKGEKDGGEIGGFGGFGGVGFLRAGPSQLNTCNQIKSSKSSQIFMNTA